MATSAQVLQEETEGSSVSQGSKDG